MNNKASPARRTAFMGILFALALALSYLENLLPPLPLLPAGFKIGLSNIVTMYCLYFVGLLPALTVAALKAAFSFLLRGFTASALSLSGGVLSVCVMWLLSGAEKRGAIGRGMLSVAGALAHNVGQLAMCCVLLETTTVLYYAPVLIVAGVLTGLVTGTVLEVSIKALSKMNK